MTKERHDLDVAHKLEGKNYAAASRELSAEARLAMQHNNPQEVKNFVDKVNSDLKAAGHDQGLTKLPLDWKPATPGNGTFNNVTAEQLGDAASVAGP